MFYSKQKWFCTNCGNEQHSSMVIGQGTTIGREWKCCSMECHEEIKWKETLSIMGKEYYPRENK